MSGTPNEKPIFQKSLVKPQSAIRSIARVVFALIAIGLLIVILLFSGLIRNVRPAAERTQCSNNLRQFVIAMHDYETANGFLPPAYTVDAKGNRLHSWRALILPYLDENELFEMIDFSKPWDHPVNKKAREKSLDFFSCPSVSLEKGLTTYLGVVGDDCFFAGSDSRKFSDITDGTSSTIALVDVDSSKAVHWMSPNDVSLEEILKYGPNSKLNHPKRIVTVFVDGSVKTVSLSIGKKNIRALLTIARGDEFNFDRQAVGKNGGE